MARYALPPAAGLRSDSRLRTDPRVRKQLAKDIWRILYEPGKADPAVVAFPIPRTDAIRRKILADYRQPFTADDLGTFADALHVKFPETVAKWPPDQNQQVRIWERSQQASRLCHEATQTISDTSRQKPDHIYRDFPGFLTAPDDIKVRNAAHFEGLGCQILKQEPDREFIPERELTAAITMQGEEKGAHKFSLQLIPNVRRLVRSL